MVEMDFYGIHFLGYNCYNTISAYPPKLIFGAPAKDGQVLKS